MTAIRSTKTIRTKDRTAKPTFRGYRGIVTAAAVIAFGLLAAPLQADHALSDVSVTLTATVGNDDMITLDVSANPPVNNNDPSQQTGLQFRYRQGDGVWAGDDDGWETVGLGSLMWEPLGDGPFYFQARVWNYRKVDGEWHASVSESSAVVTVDLNN